MAAKAKNKQKNHRWASSLVVFSLWRGEGMAVRCTLQNLDVVKKEMAKLKKAPEAILKRTENEIKTRGRSWIAQGVATRYNIKKKEITNGDVGSIKFKGSLSDSTLKIVCSGRNLTPIHFGMNPTTKPRPGEPYTMKWQVLRKTSKPSVHKIKKPTKAQRKNIGRNYTHQSIRTNTMSPWMLQPTGTKDPDKTPYIPFQRRPKGGNKMAFVARAVSLPQMVTEGKDGPIHPEVAKIFYENLEKRFNHHVDRALK